MQEHLIGEFKVIHILSGAIPAPRARVGAESLTLEVLHTDNSDDKASSGYCSDDTILGDKCRNVAYEDGQNEVPKQERFWHSVNIEEHLMTDPAELVWGQSESHETTGA